MSGIEYINEDLSTHPQCPHGPTLLFSRCINDNGDRRNFFACAACRDRKYCNFFLWESDKHKISDAKKNVWKIEQEKFTKHINHKKCFLLLNEMQQLNQSLRIYCDTCSIWVKSDKKNVHENHDVKNSVSDEDIFYPTTFLKPLSNDKKEAQYLFSKSSVKTIINILQNLNIKNVLCIGAPRIHENIIVENAEMSSLLLDFDQRYHNFFGPLQFCWYNLFNHHFFLAESKNVFADFLQSNNGNDLAIIMDPPFGGRMEPIAQTLKLIEKQYQEINNVTKKIPVFLFFPYFMEPQILNSVSDYNMSDYKVDYDNHSLFQDGVKGRKFGSPVRFFTNLCLSKINLSNVDGYKWCKICNKWVYNENKHCNICKLCTSKDGRTYMHCNKCKKCVKPTWVHCEECKKCSQPDHKCGNIAFKQCCFHCKERGHKKNECPKINHEQLKRKRNSNVVKNKNKRNNC